MENTPLYILLADDDETDRLLFKEAFEEVTIKTIVHTVNNGMQLMEYLIKKGNRLPHLLFLDLNMPQKNGIECLKEIKSNRELKEIPIAIYSTSASEKDMKEAFGNGANVYIHKPTEFNKLIRVLEKTVVMAYQYQDPDLNKENFLLKI